MIFLYLVNFKCLHKKQNNIKGIHAVDLVTFYTSFQHSFYNIINITITLNNPSTEMLLIENYQ